MKALFNVLITATFIFQNISGLFHQEQADGWIHAGFPITYYKATQGKLIAGSGISRTSFSAGALLADVLILAALLLVFNILMRRFTRKRSTQ